MGAGPALARSQTLGLAQPTLQLSPQHFDDLAQGLLVSSIPPPLAFLGSFDEPGFSENRHVMRDRWLREMNPSLDIASAKTGPGALDAGGFRFRAAFAQGLKDTPPGRIGDGV
jgi:hypothetical protein